MGQAPSRSSDPARPLSGRSGKFLSALIGADIARGFDLRNLLGRFPGKKDKGDAFPLWKARLAVFALGSGLRTSRVVLLGRRVADAFCAGRHLPFLKWHHGAILPGAPFAAFAILPHPSGINLWWNSPANRAAARAFLLREASR